MAATVNELSTTIVTFTFYVDGVGPISLGDGDLAVDVDSETDLPPCDPVAQDCPNGLACYLTDYETAQFECGVEGFVPDYLECFAPNECSMDSACVSFAENDFCNPGFDCCVPTCDVAAPNCPFGETCELVGTTGLCVTN